MGNSTRRTLRCCWATPRRPVIPWRPWWRNAWKRSKISRDFTREKWGISPWHMGNVDGFWPSNGIYGAFKKRVLIIKHLGGFTMFHLGWVFAVFNLAFESLDSLVWWILSFLDLAVCQNLVPLVNIKIAGKWMFIPLKMVLIGIDPYPFVDA